MDLFLCFELDDFYEVAAMPVLPQLVLSNWWTSPVTCIGFTASQFPKVPRACPI